MFIAQCCREMWQSSWRMPETFNIYNVHIFWLYSVLKKRYLVWLWRYTETVQGTLGILTGILLTREPSEWSALYSSCRVNKWILRNSCIFDMFVPWRIKWTCTVHNSQSTSIDAFGPNSFTVPLGRSPENYSSSIVFFSVCSLTSSRDTEVT